MLRRAGMGRSMPVLSVKQSRSGAAGEHGMERAAAGAAKAGDERIPRRLIGSIVAVGSLAFIGILTETVMTVLFPQLMEEFGVDMATVQWITTIYLLSVGVTMPLSSYLNRRFTMKSTFVAAVALAVVG